MNATQTAIADLITGEHLTVADLVAQLGKSETTVRKALKDIEGVEKDGAYYTIPQHASVEEIEAAITAGEQAATRKYQRHDIPTTRTVRVNQTTKAEVAVRRTDENKKLGDKYGITTKYFTECLTHGHAHGEDRVTDAHWFSTYPTFCPTCKPLLEGKIGRRRKSAEKVPAGVKFKLA